jgi:hypothetical protein
MQIANQKKAVRLEDKLKEAEAALVVARAALAAKEAEIADQLAVAEREYKEADDKCDLASKTLERTKAEVQKRLGLTPAATRKAVLAWAGLAPGEEHEAIIRGESKILDEAIAHLTRYVVSQDTRVIAASKASDAAYKVRLAKGNVKSALDREVWNEERRVSQLEQEIKSIRDRIDERDINKKLQAEDPKKAPVSKEDQARFVEARRRLTLAANGRERGSWSSSWHNEGAKAKLDPPFVWPPKEAK